MTTIGITAYNFSGDVMPSDRGGSAGAIGRSGPTIEGEADGGCHARRFPTARLLDRRHLNFLGPGHVLCRADPTSQPGSHSIKINRLAACVPDAVEVPRA